MDAFQSKIPPRYHVEGHIGAGASGDVLAVHDLQSDRLVALKLLHPGAISMDRESLRVEFEILSKLHHPHILRVLDYGIGPGQHPYLVSEHIETIPFETFQTHATPELVHEFLVQTANALSYLHQNGILHGDLKPGNLLIQQTGQTNCHIYVSDFGLAQHLTRGCGHFCGGTFPYIAPESLHSGITDPRSDLFALGVILAELITGANPFPSMQDYRKFLDNSQPCLHLPADPQWTALATITERLMRPNPDARFISAQDILYVLGWMRDHRGATRGYIVGSSFTGRNHEMEHLNRAAASARDGSFQSVIITGSHGTGKSRLLREFEIRMTLQDQHCSRSSGVPHPLFRSISGWKMDTSPHPPKTVKEWEQHLIQSAQDHPRILIMDDIDQADSGSREVISGLMKNQPSRIMIILAGTDFDTGGVDVGSVIALDALPREDARAMVASQFIPPLDDSLLDRIVEMGSCLPGRLVRTISCLQKNQTIIFSGAYWRWNPANPITLPTEDGAFASIRIDLLPENDRQCLAELACIDALNQPDLMAAVTGRSIPEIQQCLRRLINDGIIVKTDETLHFSDWSIRETAGNRLSLEKQQQFHRTTAEYLCALPNQEEMAGIHYLKCGDPAAALPLLFASMLHNQRSGSLTGALELLEKVKSAADSTGHTAYRWKERLERGNIWMRLGDLDAAAIAYKEALHILGADGDTGVRCTLLGNLAMVCLKRSEITDSKQFLDDALNLARTHGLTDREALLQAQLGNLHFQSGNFESAANCFRNAIPVFRSNANEKMVTSTLNNLGSTLEMTGDLEGAMQAYLDVLPLKRKMKDKLGEAILLHNIGHLSMEQGETGSARRRLKDAEKLLSGMGEITHRAHLSTSLALVNIYSGRYTDASNDLESAQRAAQEIQSDDLLHYITSVRGYYLMAQGNMEAAFQAMFPRYEMIANHKTPSLNEWFLLGRLIVAVVHSNQKPSIDLERIREQFQRAQSRNPIHRCDSLLTDAEFLSQTEKHDEALSVIKQCIQLSESCNLRIKETQAKLMMVNLLTACHDYKSAASVLNQRNLIAHLERNQLFPFLCRWLFWSEAVHRKLKRFQAADACLRDAEKMVANLQRRLPDDASPELLKKSMMPCVHDSASDHTGSTSLAISVENDMEDRRKLMMVLEVVRVMARERSLDNLLHLIVDKALELTGAERGFCLLKGTVEEDELLVGRNISRVDILGGNARISSSILEQVLSTGVPVHIRDSFSDELFKRRSSIQAWNLRTILCAPLHRTDGTAHDASREAMGVLYVDSTATGPQFTALDREVFESLAVHAAIGIENLRSRNRLTRENQELRQKVESQYRFGEIVGTSEAMLGMLRMVEKVAPSNANVLILGESGTGKELIARTIHFNGPRAREAFLGVNCAALTESILESELFGVEAGVASGVSRRTGLFVQADKGTLFLDEIGDMPLPMQAKILRVIQERKVRPVGAKHSVDIDVRIVCATNKDLWESVRAGQFREDLLFRLDVISILIPPLRDRREDIPVLAQYFLRKHAEKANLPVPEIAPETLDILMQYAWPGNVRELENQMERVIILADRDNAIQPGDLSPRIAHRIIRERPLTPEPRLSGSTGNLKHAVADLETQMIRSVLKETDGNKSRTSEILGLSREGLRLKMERLGIPTD